MTISTTTRARHINGGPRRRRRPRTSNRARATRRPELRRRAAPKFTFFTPQRPFIFVVTVASSRARAMSDDRGARAVKARWCAHAHRRSSSRAERAQFGRRRIFPRRARFASAIILLSPCTSYEAPDARFVRAGTLGRFERCSYAVTRRVRSRFSREFALRTPRVFAKPMGCAGCGTASAMGGGAGLSCYADVRVATGAHGICDAGVRDRAVSGRRGGMVLNGLCRPRWHESQSHGARVRAQRQGDRTGDALRGWRGWERDVAARVEALPVGARASDGRGAAAAK